MADDELRVEVIGHATLRVRFRGRTLLTDPWLVDPMVCRSGFHFPPLVHDPAEVAAGVDAIYISHPHPDHFHRPTLALFPRRTPVYIGAYRRKGFRDAVRALGFPVVEVPFHETRAVAGTDFEISIIEHDYDETATYDSALVVRTPEWSLFENNDCVLRPEKYVWVRERFRIDYAFLGYSPASFFPISFEMEAAEKQRLLREAAERRYGDFLAAAGLLGARLTVPFASGLRFLHESALWKNASFSSAVEAVRRLEAAGLAGAVLGPGDGIRADGSIRRRSTVLEPEEERAAIAAYAQSVRGWIDGLTRAEAPPRGDLVARFRAYLLGLFHETRDRLPGVRAHVIAYVLVGAGEQRFYFDFSRPDEEIFQWGEPLRYDMRYTYPASGLQMRLDGEIDWDELHFTHEVSVHQVTYAREFYRMLRSGTLDLG